MCQILHTVPTTNPTRVLTANSTVLTIVVFTCSVFTTSVSCFVSALVIHDPESSALLELFWKASFPFIPGLGHFQAHLRQKLQSFALRAFLMRLLRFSGLSSGYSQQLLLDNIVAVLGRFLLELLGSMLATCVVGVCCAPNSAEWYCGGCL